MNLLFRDWKRGFRVRVRGAGLDLEMVVEHPPEPDPNAGFLKLVCRGEPIEKGIVPKSFFYTFAFSGHRTVPAGPVWVLYQQSTTEGPAPAPGFEFRIEPMEET